MISEQTKEYYQLGKKNDVRESAKRLRRQFLRYKDAEIVYSIQHTKINKNANLTMCGTSGAGKTFTLQLLALRMRMRGIQCYIIAPIKGHEFKRACSKIGGEFIKIAPGSPHCINVMEIRHTISPEMELIDEVDYNDMDSMLARKIQQLMIFFSLLIPDMTNEEEQMLDEALIKTYNDFGITHDNNSLYVDANVYPPKLKKMPILGDLHKHLQDNPMTARVAAIVSRFVTGSAQSFNRQTNVDLKNKYIVLDLLQFITNIDPRSHQIADTPSQIRFLQGNTFYEIVVLDYGEEHLTQFLHPEKNKVFLIVVPDMDFAEGLWLPDAKCIFVTLEASGNAIPEVDFYSA